MKLKNFIATFVFVLVLLTQVSCLDSNAPTGSPKESTGSILEKHGNGDFYTGLTSSDVIVASNMFSKNVVTMSEQNINQTEIEVSPNCDTNMANKSCKDGHKVALIKNCKGLENETIVNGYIALHYTSNTCEFKNPEDSVTINYVIYGKNDETEMSLLVNTKKHKNYLQEELGGGETYTLKEDGFTFDSMGKNNFFQAPKLVISTTHDTDGPVRFAKDPVSGIFSIDGTIVSHQNILGKTQKATFNQVKLDPPQCCHPIDGSLEVVFSGRVKGQAKVSYSANCGEVEITINGQNSVFAKLDKCD
jgi:hypothetical protein